MRLIFIILILIVSGCTANERFIKALQYHEDKSYVEAYYEYKSLADKGDVRGFFGVGSLIDSNNLPDTILAKENPSLFYFCQGALKGHASSQYIIGLNYISGIDVPYDFNQAILWHKLSANQGLIVSQHSLGFTYFLGIEVERDLKEALFWFAMSGVDSDDGKFEAIMLQISEEDVNLVLDRIKLWKPVAIADSIPSNVDPLIRPDLSICNIESR